MKNTNVKLLKEVISNVESQFIINQHGRVVLTDEHCEQVEDMVMEAHCIAGERSPILPCNFIYETLYRLLIGYEAATSIDDLHDFQLDPEPSNWGLLDWSNTNLVRSYYVQQAMAEYTARPDIPSFFEVLTYAQCLEIEDIKSVLARYLEDEFNCRLNEAVEMEG